MFYGCVPDCNQTNEIWSLDNIIMDYLGKINSENIVKIFSENIVKIFSENIVKIFSENFSKNKSIIEKY
jgi:hypothetical protein